MTTAQKLVIFDVDGTLVDSQAFILSSMEYAFSRVGLPVPHKRDALGVIGLSLPEAMAVLVPDAGADDRSRLVDLYKESFVALRQEGGGESSSPLYPGARTTIERLHGEGYLLSAATGKARRGLTHFLESHDLSRYFVGTHCADDAPSKPHPGMILKCLAATGAQPDQSVMIGDTDYDMAMGQAAGVRTIGVSWGYQPTERLVSGGAEAIARDFSDVPEMVTALWKGA